MGAFASLRDTVTAAVNGGAAVAAGEVKEPDERETVGKWLDELKHAKKFFERFHKQATTSVEAFVDEKIKGVGSASDAMPNSAPPYRLNLYHADIITVRSMLYAKIPKAEADRRFYDPSDDVARVAAEMVTRIIQNDMNDPDDKLDAVLKSALEDRLVTGLGSARVKYSMTEKPIEPAPMDAQGQPVLDDQGNPPTEKDDEWTDVVYTHWRDILWNPCRVASELRWKAFRSYMSKEEVTDKWGEDVATLIPYSTKQPKLTDATSAQPLDKAQPEAQIWEIWSHTNQCVYWVVEGYDKFLDHQDNPMELDGFYPDATPLLANTTTSRYIPKPDYEFARDLYAEIDELETRIVLLTRAAKCVGVYDRASKDVSRLLKEGVENQLIPVDNWAMFAEKGGLKGMIDWLPLEQVVGAIQTLGAQQASRVQQLYQVTGLADIMRGQATQQGVTATEQKIKAQYGSGRIQAIQDEFADFVTALLNKKVQLIQKFYDPQRIIKLSNIMNTPDAQFAQQALALIKSPDFNARISVKSESMAQENKDALKEQRGLLIQGVAQFLGMAQPFIEKTPESAPFLMQLLQFSIAGYSGASQMEGIVDQMIAKTQEKLDQAAANPQPPQPPPAVQVATIRAQSDAAATQADAAAAEAKAQSEMQLTQMKEEFRQQTEAMKAQFEAERVSAAEQLKAATAIIVAAIGAKSKTETAQVQADSAHKTAQISAEATAEAAANKEVTQDLSQ